MKYPAPIFFLVAGAVLLLPTFAAAEPVDPCTPEEWRAMQEAQRRELPGWLPTRIRQLEAERDQLLETISTLPQFAPVQISDHLGYHSGYADQDGGGSDHQLTIHFERRFPLSAIALVPTMNPRERHGDNYAFPKRFRLEVLKSKTKWPDAENDWVKVVNWMDEDFPDPGRYPVFFHVPERRIRKVRITVPPDGQAFFALGELFLFREVEGRIADNMSVWGSPAIEKFEVSDAFSLQPFWDLEYLHDGLTGLGVPLSEERLAADDLIMRFNDEVECNPVQIVMDLGRTQAVGRVEIWPAEAPGHLAAPLYAFPGKVKVELSNDPDFGEVKTVVVDDARASMYHDNLLRIMCRGYRARYIRLTLDALREENGRRILGIGEVSVLEYGKVFSVGCEVAASGIPAEYQSQLPSLVDGNCRGRRILSETEWIMGLAQRRPLDHRLAVVNHELAAARKAWRALLVKLRIGAGALLCLGLLVAMGLQRLQRRKVLKNLKTRIMRDLHDDVGGGLGGIALKTGVLEGMVADETVKMELGDVSLMARETGASLREVVWMLDQQRILLSALMDKLAERAERVLHGVQLSIERSPDVPNLEVSLTCKRHLIMFFKEAVHNCARHANATHVTVSILVEEDRLLHLSVQDDGCGFDPAEKPAGWGLGNMKKRAEELHGDLELHSVPGEGTLVELTLPMDILSREPTKAYKTSN